MKILITKEGVEVMVDDDLYGSLSAYEWHTGNDYNVYRIYKSNNGSARISLLETIQPHRSKEGYYSDRVNTNNYDYQRSNLTYWYSFSSQYKGVSYNERQPSKPWSAKIHHKGNIIRLGLFATEVEAARAYDAKAKEVGKEGRLNFPDE